MNFTSASAAARNADQLESDAVRSGSAPLSTCLTDELIAGDDLSELFVAATNPLGNTTWADQDAARETAEVEAADEVERRANLLGPFYPFSLSTDRAQLAYHPDRSRCGVYEFCLAFATTGHELKAKPYCFAVREFERVVGRLLAAHLGTGAKWFRFGYPPESKRGDERPTTLTAALAYLHGRTHGEWAFTPPTGTDAQAEQGDGDIDVVVWKPFGDVDTRRGMPFLLAQCACGDDGLQPAKWNSLQPRQFEDRFNGRFSLGNLPLKCFATPYHVPHAGRWHQMVSDAGIVLDRVRLTWMAETYLTAGEFGAIKATLDGHSRDLNSSPVHLPAVNSRQTRAKRQRK